MSEFDRPTHHTHSENEPLPGAKGADSTVDYSAGNMERMPSSVLNKFTDPTSNPNRNPMPRDTDTGPEYPRSGTVGEDNMMDRGAEYPRDNVDLKGQNTSEGDVAVDHQLGHPERKATLADKVIGKTQQVMGKVSHNQTMLEKGELRQSGGKDAVTDEMRT